MRLSTAVRYGARAMTQVASAHPDRAVSVREVAEQQAISPKYLEQIFRPLRVAGLVQAVRGKQGGYVLARSPESITLKDLYEVLVGSVVPVACVDCPDFCVMCDVCPTGIRGSRSSTLSRKCLRAQPSRISSNAKSGRRFHPRSYIRYRSPRGTSLGFGLNDLSMPPVCKSGSVNGWRPSSYIGRDSPVETSINLLEHLAHQPADGDWQRLLGSVSTATPHLDGPSWRSN